MPRKSLRILRSSLILKLMGAFLLVIVIGALVIYFLTTQATQNAFRLYTTQNSQLVAERLAPDFANFYVQANSWQDVGVFMQTSLAVEGMPGMMNGVGAGRGQGRGAVNGGGQGLGWMGGMGQRLILADSQGRVIADSAAFSTPHSENILTGSQLSADELASGASVMVNNHLIGTLIVAPGDQRAGPNPASTFLTTVNRSILISVLIAGGVGLLLVSLFFFQITAPIRQMQRAAGAIAKGDLSQRVLVRSKDELGDLAESFNHMASSLGSAETQRQKLLADVAHELRTPLAVIQANTEAMQDGVLPIDLEQVNAIHAETLLLGRLINDLRLISLAEAGALRLERRPTDLNALLQSVVERFQPQCAQKGVGIDLSVDSHLPMVTIDTDRMTQVLNNLVSNALRYTPEGGRIILHTTNLAEDDHAVQVSVTDTGSGIAADDLPWVFDRFYRADKSRTRASGGSGLGLAIVKQLVEAHGGRVGVESPVCKDAQQVDCGTRITFTLPIG
jgi:signal transduction histidine kinase